MKNFFKLLFASFCLVTISINGYAQVVNHQGHNHRVLNDQAALAQFNLTGFISEFTDIALKKGYRLESDACLRNAFVGQQSNLFSDIFEAYKENMPQSEYTKIYNKHIVQFSDYLELFQRNEALLRAEFKRRTESASQSIPSNPSYFRTANPNAPLAACTNMDFEAGNLSGWTTTTTGAGSSYVTTTGTDGFVPAINTVYAGNNSACIDVIGGGNPGDNASISQTFMVTNANKDFIFYTAVIFNSGGHACNQNPAFEVSVKDAGGAIVPCSQISLISANSSGGSCSAYNGFVTSGSYDYLNWTPVIVPLGNYVGQNVTIKFSVTRCVGSGNGGHGARAYIEASCNPVPLMASASVVCAGTPVTLTAPSLPGYTYTWSGPSGFSGSTAVVHPSLAGAYTVTMAVTSNPSCKMVVDTVLTAAPSPTASFNYTVAPCSPTNTVPVVSTSTPGAGDPISSYTWVWGDGTGNGSGASTNHTYATSGPKTVQLTVTSAGGCTATASQSFTFVPGPSAGFNVNNSCLGAASNFTSTSTPTAGILSQVWDFGDGVTDNTNTFNPTHTYATTGVKTVNYTITATGGCTNTAVKTVTIATKPVMAISSNTVCQGVATTFGNTSSSAPDAISNWAWDFDNNASIDNTTQAPTYTYPTAGNFTAVLSATNTSGCTNSVSIGVKVNALPTATFTPGSACLNSNVALNNTSSVAAPDALTNYSWNFGTGASPATANGPTANPTPLIYSTSGPKVITLTVTANTSCTATISQPITVYASPVANFNTTSVCQSTATAFTDASTPAGTIANWAWDFTNNNSIDNTTNAPTFVYPSSGTYTASLIVTDNNGCKDTVALPVNVWGHAIPDFTATTVCYNVATSFGNTTNTTTNANVGGTPTWNWNFGDGVGTSNAQNPSYTYPTAGSYSATLTVTTTNGCVDNVTKAVNVNTLPTATFTPVNACMNSNVLLNNTSSIPSPDNISSYSWNFGAGASPATSSAQNPPILTYPTSGVKTITLLITANTTCTATITQTVDVYPQPVANFSATSVCQSTATAFTDLSTTSVGTITGWAWDFTNNGGAPDISGIATTSTVFATSGTYSTSLIVTTSNNCKDTVVLPINVWGHTIPDFTPDKVCYGTASTFSNLTNETANTNVGTGTTYSWNFADNTPVSNAVSPTHVYTLGGNANATYTVTLVATSGHGCADSIKKAVSVYALPTASFTSNRVCLGTATSLTDASNGNGNTVNAYAWDFESNGTVDVTGVPNPNYVFPSFGNNNVSYTVSTSPVTGLVCSNSTNTIQIWVEPLPVPDFTFVNKCINAQPNTFDGFSSTIAVGTNTNYAWAFGDSQTSNTNAASTISHVYTSPGTYNATLTVTSDKGCQTKVVKQVEVYAKPIMAIANSPACDQKAMTFTAVAQPNSGTVTNWYWDMNSSITTVEATGQTIGYTFSGPGTHPVSLISETSRGCKDTIAKQIYVNYVPVANFIADTLMGCPHPKFCVNFRDLSPAITGPAQLAQWIWTFGDGTGTSNNTNAGMNHCYTNSSSSQVATFDVSLQVVSDSGCVSAVNVKSAYISVYPTPVANYTVTPNPGSVVQPLEYFTNQSVGYTKWWWSFGDGPFNSDSVNVSPTHFYSDETAQTYNTHLIVMNQYGCRDTASVLVEIGPEFTFYIPNAFTPANEDNINDMFTGKGIGIAKYEMWIFDRWGANIFYTDDIAKGWNGKVQGKSQEVQQDVYVWKVKLLDVLGKKHEYIGHVTVLR